MRRPPLHPACKIFPALGETELKELADDIATNGLQNPIVLLDGKLLDGRNRFAACKIAGIKPQFVEFAGDDPIRWVTSQNLVRRHLTASQRAVVALDLLPMLEKEAKQRQRRSNEYRGTVRSAQKCAIRGKAAEHAAKIANASTRYVEIVKQINESHPEIVNRVRTGEISIPEARKLAAVASSNGKRRRTRISNNDRGKIIHGDCLDLIPSLDDGSVHFVLTSPPYAEQRNQHYLGVSEGDFPDWTVAWMELLWDKLTDDGSVMMVIRPHLRGGVLSDYVLRTRLALRENGWYENEELIWLKPDAPPLGSTKRPRRTWESILWFSRSPQPYCDLFACGHDSNRIGFDASIRFGTGNGSPIHGGQDFEMKSGKARCPDVFVAPIGGNPSWNNHPAVFPEVLAEQLILTFSSAGDLVFDPFVGSGTTCAAAKKLGREFRGFDISKKYVNLTLERLSKI